MNILLTSAGRRSYLVEYFRRALSKRGSVHVANSDPFCSSFAVEKNHIVTPLISDKSYVEFILSYCLAHNIHAIFPLLDQDVLIIAQQRQIFIDHDIFPVVPSFAVSKTCFDKIESNQFLSDNNIPTPCTYTSLDKIASDIYSGALDFPFIVKPRFGMGSRSIYKANNMEQLSFFFSYSDYSLDLPLFDFFDVTQVSDVFAQPYLDGQEFSIDILNDINGNYVSTTAKKKLSMRAGETEAALIVDDTCLMELGSKIGSALGHIGNLDVDLIFSGSDYYVLDLNCRFGGGYPFTHLAGADYISVLVDQLSGCTPSSSYLSIKNGLTICKSISPIVIL